MRAERSPKQIGLAIVGAGRIGLIRGEIAAKHPNVGWIGVAEIRADRAKEVAERIGADFVTTDYRELLARPEATAAVIATDENAHVDPILAAIDRRLDLLIEKPLATDLKESARVLAAIQQSGVDAVVGYTQRFRRRFLVAKEKV
ncbi:MAG: Gfo/Idh/MocA family oxidoreductase, partial [Candidatus Rokubacteria bacterium]|nr:Gfo/Idh/MocA family oxidoreductase [Candidatus Rokubacteria bacterium]